jgi:F420H(2)-dependent biliverdin reductase
MSELTSPKLITDRNVWLATTRPNGKPHLVPIWFAWVNDKFYLCTQTDSVKVKNLQANPRCSIALEDGNNPVIGEGEARFLSAPFDDAVAAVFKAKYDWDIHTDTAYRTVIEIVVTKWVKW